MKFDKIFFWFAELNFAFTGSVSCTDFFFQYFFILTYVSFWTFHIIRLFRNCLNSAYIYEAQYLEGTSEKQMVSEKMKKGGWAGETM